MQGINVQLLQPAAPVCLRSSSGRLCSISEQRFAGMRCLRPASAPSQTQRRCRGLRLSAYKVEIDHPNGTTILEVEDDQTILEAALENGLQLSHDCKMGVCMTCPARLVDGQVDQSAGMLDDEVKEKGYALLCVSQPTTDCKVRIIDEDELLEQVLQGGS